MGTAQAITLCPLQIVESVLHYLLGEPYQDQRLSNAIAPMRVKAGGAILFFRVFCPLSFAICFRETEFTFHRLHPGHNSLYDQAYRLCLQSSYGGLDDLTGVLGFEPRNGGTKTRCLTTWLHPIGFALPIVTVFMGKMSSFFEKILIYRGQGSGVRS